MYLSNLSVYIIVGIIATDFALGIATLTLVTWLSCRRNGDENDERLYQSDCITVVPELEDAREIGVYPDGGVLGASVHGSTEIAWGGVQEQYEAIHAVPEVGEGSACPLCWSELVPRKDGTIYCSDWCEFDTAERKWRDYATDATRGGAETSEGVSEAWKRAVRGSVAEAGGEGSGGR